MSENQSHVGVLPRGAQTSSFPGTGTSQIGPPSVNATLLVYLVAQSRKSGHTASATKSYFLSSPRSPLLSLLAAIGLVQIL